MDDRELKQRVVDAAADLTAAMNAAADAGIEVDVQFTAYETVGKRLPHYVPRVTAKREL